MKIQYSKIILIVSAIAVLMVINYDGLFAQESDVTIIEWRGEEVKVISNTVLIHVNRAYFDKKEELFSRIKHLPIQASVNPLYGRIWDGWARVRFTGDEVTIRELIQELIQMEEVDLAEPDIVYEIGSLPDDTWFDYQWNLNNTGENTGHLDLHDELVAGADIDALKAWGITESNENVIVVVFDTGIDLDGSGNVHHPDMDNPNMHLKGANYTSDWNSDQTNVKDNHGHGTWVSGVVFAEKNNDEGIAGIAPGVKALHYKVCNENGGCSGSWFRNAAVHLIDEYVTNPTYSDYRFIVNFSAGGGYSSTLDIGVDTLGYYKIPLVTITQNQSTNTITYPGAYSTQVGYEHVTTVGASTHRDQWRATNNWGPEVTLVAPGGGINVPRGVNYEVDSENNLTSCNNSNNFDHWEDWWSTSDPCSESSTFGDLYERFDNDHWASRIPTTRMVGTGSSVFDNEPYGLHGASSMAAPHVAAVAGLMLSVNNQLTPEQIRDILTTTADKVG